MRSRLPRTAVNWKFLNFRFHNHDWKSVGLALHAHNLSLPDQGESQTVKEVITSGLFDEFAQLAPMRELALYVNYTRKHGFVAPHDMNWHDEAVQAIEQARRAIEDFERSLPPMASVLRGKLTHLQQEQLMRRVQERHAMIEDALAQAEAEGWADD